MANTIDPSLYLSTYQSEQRQTGSSSLGKDDFLKILMAQLQNQDPLNPMEDTEYVSQMATFSSLEQLMNIGDSLESFLSSQQQNLLISYNQFVGKDITWHRLSSEVDENGAPIIEEGTGKVASIQFKDNNAYFILEDGTELEPGNISQVNNAVTENYMIQASMLIGKTVTYLDEDKEEKVSTVQSVSFKDGKTLFQLNDEADTKITASQITKIE